MSYHTWMKLMSSKDVKCISTPLWHVLGHDWFYCFLYVYGYSLELVSLLSISVNNMSQSPFKLAGLVSTPFLHETQSSPAWNDGPHVPTASQTTQTGARCSDCKWKRHVTVSARNSKRKFATASLLRAAVWSQQLTGSAPARPDGVQPLYSPSGITNALSTEECEQSGSSWECVSAQDGFRHEIQPHLQPETRAATLPVQTAGGLKYRTH